MYTSRHSLLMSCLEMGMCCILMPILVILRGSPGISRRLICRVGSRSLSDGTSIAIKTGRKPLNDDEMMMIESIQSWTTMMICTVIFFNTTVPRLDKLTGTRKTGQAPRIWTGVV